MQRKPNICPFCDQKQSYRVIRQGQFFKLVYPKSPAIAHHVLIVPTRHVKTFDEITPEYMQDFVELLSELVQKARGHLGASFLGYNLLSNNGSEAVNQRVPHAHIHIFLRTDQDESDPVKDKSDHQQTPPPLTEQQLENLATIKAWYTQSN